MAHLLDRGPLLVTREALDERLKLIFPESVFEHAFVSARLSVVEWQELIRRTPLIALGWGGMTPKENVGKAFEGGSDWTVFVAVKNSAGPLPLYVGDPHGHGLFHVVQAAVAGLHGMMVRPAGGDTRETVGHVSVKGASNLVIQDLDAEDIGIAAVDLRTTLTLPAAANADDFLRTGTTWSFPGEGSAEATLPFQIREASAE